MKLLALDTSTEACSVALALDGEIIERFELEQRHGERLLAMVDELLAQASVKLTQLDAIGFGRGPGSFTSLRIGAGVVQGLAFGADLAVVPVSSLAVLAQGVDAVQIAAAFDARMRQVYWGLYIRDSGGLVKSVSPEVVVDPTAVPIPSEQGWIGAGSGWDAYHTVLDERLGAAMNEWIPRQHPRARDVAALAIADFTAGRFVKPQEALPVYIRDDVATKSSGRG